MDSASPVAYRPGVISGTDVSVYPLGLPVFLAAARTVGGELAPFLVTPLSAALFAWCAFLIGRAMAGGSAGVLAAILVASSPVTLLHSVDTMSDVPAAALWLLAWALALTPSAGAATAAGAAVAAAVLIRPNLAPLAIVPGVLVLLDVRARLRQPSSWRLRNALLFAAVAAIGPAMVAWSQSLLYGGPLTPGYVEWATFFRVAHIEPNLRLYPRLLIALHGAVPLLGLVAAVTIRGRVVWSALAMLLLNFAIYLPYLSLDDWPFLRFLLPGLAALFILLAAVTAQAGAWIASRSRWLTPLVLVPLVLVIMASAAERRYALNEWTAQTRVRLMGHYLRETLPQDAAVLSFMHSGAVRHYTGRQIVRLDLLEPTTLDRVVDDLRRHGYRPVFVLDEAIERDAFRARFPQSRYGRLDWDPRATFRTVTGILYFVAADRDAFAAGARWPIDALK